MLVQAGAQWRVLAVEGAQSAPQALALDAAIFGRVPDMIAIAGSVLIAAGGLMLAAQARRP